MHVSLPSAFEKRLQFLTKSQPKINLKIKKNGMMSEYRYGELLENNFDNEILSAKVSHISASGGWTRMDYYLTIEK